MQVYNLVQWDPYLDECVWPKHWSVMINVLSPELDTPQQLVNWTGFPAPPVPELYKIDLTLIYFFQLILASNTAHFLLLKHSLSMHSKG